MSFKWLLLIPLIVAGCTSDDESPPCSYKSVPRASINESPIPASFGLSIDQKKLMGLLWTPVEQGPCYLLKNDRIHTYKIEDPRFSSNDDTYKAFSPATSYGQQEWFSAQNTIGDRLLGLTVLGFQSQPTESLISARIYVRSDGHAWSLWHEYTHALIGQIRWRSPSLNLKSIHRSDVLAALDKAIADEDHWTHFSDLEIEFMQKNFGDEILIESLLLDYARQANQELGITHEQTQNALALISQFYHDFQRYKAEAITRIAILRTSAALSLKEKMDQHIQRIQDLDNAFQQTFLYLDAPYLL